MAVASKLFEPRFICIGIDIDGLLVLSLVGDADLFLGGCGIFSAFHLHTHTYLFGVHILEDGQGRCGIDVPLGFANPPGGRR